MAEFEWLTKLLPDGAAATAVISVVAIILLRYVPTLIEAFKEIIHEERELFRGEMKELRASFSAGLREMTAAFTDRDEVLSDRIDGLTVAHRDLRDEVKGLKDRLEN